MTCSWIRYGLIVALMALISFNGKSQTTVPEILFTGTLTEQANYIEEKTRIYENYRAIREDIFQKIKENALDSLSLRKKEIAELMDLNRAHNNSIDSLNATLENIKGELDQVTLTKNSIRLFGFEVNKITYNSVMWTIILVLIVLLASGFLAYKRNRNITINTKRDFEDLKKEFEAYRKSSREAREKMSMAHFNELRKLRGG